MANSNKNGFIVDVPKALVTTTSGDLQVYNADSGEIKFAQEVISISGGWSPMEIMELDTKKTVDITLTDTMFQMDALKLSTGGSSVIEATTFKEFGVPYTVVAATHKITIPAVVDASSVRINDYTETTGTPTAAQFVVSIGATDTEILFNTAADGKTLYPSYTVTTAATTETLTVTQASFAKSGECYLTFPIYDDENANSICAYGQFTIYKAKIKAEQTFGGKYKSASTFVVTLKGLDAGRSDGNLWNFKYKLV
jgi:hypothetical protein